MESKSTTYTLIIGDKSFSSWSMRPWLALREANIPFHEIKITLDTADTGEQLRKNSPSSKVPVLVHAPGRVWDSLAICEFIAEESPRLWPRERYARAQARSMVAEMHSGFPALRQELSMDLRIRIKKTHMTPAARSDIRRVATIWNECLGENGGPYLFGDAFTIADAFFTPVDMRFHSYGIEIKEDLVTGYLECIQKNKHVQEWIRDAEQEEFPRSVF